MDNGELRTRLNAGMNDYASKPIEANKLAKLISQHCMTSAKNAD
jgi:CheY-like chemotaxis protein